MNKLAYQTAVYNAFFDELCKLGYDKDAVVLADALAKQAGIKEAIAIPFSSAWKASKALKNPALTSIAQEGKTLGQAHQLARSAAPRMAAPQASSGAASAAASRARTRDLFANARARMDRTPRVLFG